MASLGRAGRNDRQPGFSSSASLSRATDELASLAFPKTDASQGAIAAELMTPEEFQAALKRGHVHDAMGKYAQAEGKAKAPLAREEAAHYPPEDIAAFYVARRGGDWRQGAYDLVKDARSQKRWISAALWDAVAVGHPRGYVRDGEIYRPIGSPPDGFIARKVATIPAWARVVTLVANGIDGAPPVSDGVYSIEEFMRIADDLQRKPGAGEWDVLVYAMDDPNAGMEVFPYSKNNPYRRLRRAPGHQGKQIASFTYMRWDWYDFTIER